MIWFLDMGKDYKDELIMNLDRLHTTDLGIERVRRNLCLDAIDVAEWCRRKIREPHCRITRVGKNWYVIIDGNEITINAYSYTIITAHKLRQKE